MHDPTEINRELIKENALLKQRIQELEQSEAAYKRANAGLWENEEKYRLLLSELPDPIFSFTPEGQYRYVNRAFAEGVGRPAEDIIGKSIWDVFPRDEADKRFASLSQAFRTGDEKVIEVRVPRADGDRYYMTTITPVKDANGVILSAVCSSKDITARRRAEDALRESEERFREMVETLPLAIYLSVGIEQKCEYLNPMFVKLFGYAAEDIPSVEQWWPLAYPDKHYRQQVSDEWNARVKHAIETKSTIEPMEVAVTCKDGSKKHILWGYITLREKNYAYGLDLTERKQVENALRESEERFRALSENAPDIIFTIDLSGTITYVNPAWKRILGYREDEVLGRYFTDFVREEDKKIYRRQLKSIRENGETIKNYIGVVLAKDGTERIFNMNDAFNRNLDGNIIGVVGSMKDITELRDMEKKLSHAQKMESIGTLAGGIAHDFNNLLMGIQGNTSLMLMNLEPSHPNYERLKRIEGQVQSGADLTRQLLGFAREGRYEVKIVDINDIIEKTSSMFERTKKEITIRRKTGKDLWYVAVDRGQMEQVFMNLYVNAGQAMPEGGEIYLETENVLLNIDKALSYAVKPGRYVKISIKDTGTGMDEKTRERIFDPFFTTKAMGRGTGLGLAVVYGIIKGHEGMINVDSEPGYGTTFTIYLPASEKGVTNETAGPGGIIGGTETILLVDDEKVILEVNKELLESMGYIVYAAGSGQEAIAVFMEKRNEIDLVILDMIMPGISGGDTFDSLRKIKPEIKVLLSSGYSLSGQAQEIMDRGCNGFIQKPFHIEKLSSTIRKMLI
jgi:PAS domain S-box-containing protein